MCIRDSIRTSFVKRLAKELIETHKGVFTTDFDQNKKLVMEYSTVSTKHLKMCIRDSCYFLASKNTFREGIHEDGTLQQLLQHQTLFW